MKSFSVFVGVIMALAAPAATAPTNESPSSDVALFNSTLVARDDPNPDIPENDPFPLVWCEVHQPEMLNNYKVILRRVPEADIPHLCHRLWAGLRAHWFLCLASNAHCGHFELYPGEPAIEWKFTTGAGCNSGCIASAVWESTRNKYGALDQSKCN